jgi:ATP-dependent Clp endopeptidase proteolytic subunit ClpP
MRNWYDIKAAANDPQVAEVSIFDEIGYWGIQAKDFIADLNKIDAKQINVSINSPGGSVFDGLAIYNALRAKAAAGVKVKTSVLGVAASIASVIMLAGDEREMPSNAMVMTHNPWTIAMGDADELRETAGVLDQIGASLQGVYIARTGKTEDDVKAFMAKDTWMSAEEAKDMGFVTAITEEVAVSAKYDINDLPENVRALFKAAAKPPTPKEPVATRPTGEEIQALAKEAGFEEFAASWAMDETLATTDAVKTVIAAARETRSLCAIAKKPDSAKEFIKARKPLADVRAALNEMLVAEDKPTDPNPEPKNPTPDPKAQSFSATGYWANH